MDANLISVIIPVYNTAEYLPRCLDSILNNTRQEIEVLCINDGSKDNSLDVLNHYAAKDSRVRIISQENAGVSAARNHGLDEAAGRYIAFIDSDDWIHRQYFEVLLDGIQGYDADISVCMEYETYGQTEDISITAEKKSFRLLDLDQTISHSSAKRRVWGRLYRKEAIGNKRFHQEITLAEDTVFNLDVICSLENSKVVLCESRLYYYYIRSNSAVHTMNGNMLKPVAEWYLNHANTVSDQICGIYTEESLKALYSWRYGAMLTSNREELAQIRPLLQRAMTLLRSSKTLSLKKKLEYMTLSAVPLSYRLFRILHDPTLLTWEKNMRQKRKESGRNLLH